jgi:uncharacterized repeat protein (TIGR01451 family)
MINTSGGTLNNVALRATLPAGVTVDTNSLGVDGAIDANNDVVWTIGSLTAGATVYREMLLTVNGLSAGDIVDIDVMLTHDDGLEIDNSAQYAVSVVESAQSLKVSVVATPSLVNPGDTLAYTITVENTSTQPINAVTVQFRVPAELNFSNSTAVNLVPSGCNQAGTSNLVCEPREEVLWELGTIDGGAGEIITINASLLSSLTNDALISAPVFATATDATTTPPVAESVNIFNTIPFVIP